jgi:integrase
MTGASRPQRLCWQSAMGKISAAVMLHSGVPLLGKELPPVIKGGRPRSQPIDPKFLPILSEIVEHRRKLNKTTLSDLPLLSGVEMRRFLDGLIDKDARFSELSYHGLRTAWITRAASSEGKITETFAKRFVDHASTEIHEIYQRISATDLSSMFGHL